MNRRSFDFQNPLLELQVRPHFARQQVGVPKIPSQGILVLKDHGSHRALVNLELTETVGIMGARCIVNFHSGAVLRVDNVDEYRII